MRVGPGLERNSKCKTYNINTTADSETYLNATPEVPMHGGLERTDGGGCREMG